MARSQSKIKLLSLTLYILYCKVLPLVIRKKYNQANNKEI